MKKLIVGQKIHDWTVLSLTSRIIKKKELYCVCMCKCKNIKDVSQRNLARGKSKNCGCVTREKFKQRKGKLNPMWKGNNVGYDALHEWIRNRMPHNNRCENCKKSCTPDLANISQKYKRELSDWEWLCRKCHMTKDGRLKKLKEAAILKIKPPIVCIRCGRLRKHEAKGMCNSCYNNNKIKGIPIDNAKIKPVRKSNTYKLY